MKKHRQTENSRALFCPSYNERSVEKANLRTITKKFIKIVISVFNELERIGNTERFKTKITTAIEKEGLDETWDAVAKETKVYSLQKELNQIMAKLHFEEVLSAEGLKQLSDQIINAYERILNRSTQREDNNIKFEEMLKSIVSNMSRDLEYNLSTAIDKEQKTPKHKKRII